MTATTDLQKGLNEVVMNKVHRMIDGKAALGRAMLIILQAAQKFYGDPKGVKETAEKAFNDILREL
jgi:hypothetical protein